MWVMYETFTFLNKNLSYIYIYLEGDNVDHKRKFPKTDLLKRV